MKAILQRVLSASVTVDNQVVSQISRGLLVFAAVAPDDDEKDVTILANRVLKMRCWDDEGGGKWKRDVRDIGGEILCVSQFTLLAKTKKGNKPDFHGAMNPQMAKLLYDSFVKKIGEGYSHDKVKDGVFQAMMQVALVNDGPVTLEISTASKEEARSGTSTPLHSNTARLKKEKKIGLNERDYESGTNTPPEKPSQE